jgi:hypothetical protein
MRTVLVGAVVGTLAACSSSGGGAVTDPAAARAKACALVLYWVDQTGTVPFPDEATGVTTKQEVTDLARTGWPTDTGAAALFIQLYDDLSSDQPDAEYAAEAAVFMSANCS